jgi:hypothetical protein
MEWNEVENAMAGKPAECHKCHYIKVVPLPEYLPRLTCPYCEDHEWNALTEEQGGTMIKCPKCQHMVRIPGESKGCSFTAAILFLAGLTLGLLASGVLW